MARYGPRHTSIPARIALWNRWWSAARSCAAFTQDIDWQLEKKADRYWFINIICAACA